MSAKEMLDKLVVELKKPMKNIEISVAEHYALKILGGMNIPALGNPEDVKNALTSICSLIIDIHGQHSGGEMK